MASPSEFAVKHSLATAGAIPLTIATNWYLETLSTAGIALVFILFLAALNSVATLVPWGRKKA